MPQILASSLAFHPRSPDEVVAWAAEAGFHGVEFLCEPPWHPRGWPVELIARVRALLVGIQLSLHAPIADVNLMSPHPGARRLAEEEVAATLALAAELGAGSVTFHIGYKPAMGTTHAPPWPEAQAALRRLHHRARDLGVILCLENDAKLPGAYLWDLARFREILEELELQGTLDLGHAWISHGHGLLSLVPTLLPRLHVIHVHDNRGSHDEHLALGEGSSPWDQLWPPVSQVPVAVVEVKDPPGLRRSRDKLLALRGRAPSQGETDLKGETSDSAGR